jgi:hypothetical protein
MLNEDCCPQCGMKNTIIWLSCENYDIGSCEYCGFYEIAEPHKNTINQGFGFKYLDLIDSTSYSEPLKYDVDYDKEMEEFDRAVSEGQISLEGSYLTKAKENEVTFLRGDMDIFERYMNKHRN